LDEARSLSADLNNEVYPAFAEEFGIPAEDNLWEIEVEAYMRRYFQAGRKKRYAYLATWKDGHALDEPQYSISGFSSKRSDSSELTEETEEDVLRAILDGEEDAVGTIVFEAAKEIQPQSPDWERIGIPGGMGNKITDDQPEAERDGYYSVRCEGDNCYPQDAQPRGAYNSNRVLGTDFGQGDKPMRVYINDTYFDELDRTDNVLCFETAEQMLPVEDRVTVDVDRMTNTLLVKPLGRILSAIDTDIHAAIQGQTQVGLGAFE
jgi:DNA polymerase I